MKIAFCGASGTGKTTLAEFLAGKLELPLNPVGSRSVAKSLGFESPYDVDRASLVEYLSWLTDARVGQETEETQRRDAARWATEQFNVEETTCRSLFQRRLLLDKIEWEQEHDSFVTDRTVVDNFVYSALHDCRNVGEEYLEKAEEHVKQYDLIIFCTMDTFHDTAGDPKRVSERAYHQIFELFCDGTLVNWLGNDWNEKVYIPSSSDLEVRKAEILSVVRRQRDLPKTMENSDV